MTPNARQTALHILSATGRATLDQSLDNHRAAIDALNPPDRGLVHALVYGVMRWRARLDWIIGAFSKTPLARIDPAVLNILRLGLFQILYLDRIPDAAAVHTAVDLAKQRHPDWIARYVNAVLRRATRSKDRLPWPDPRKDPLGAMAVETSFPAWLLNRWIARWGREHTEALCRAVNRIPAICLRTNTLKTGRDALIAALQADGLSANPTAVSPEGVVIDAPGRALDRLATYDQGWFQVQDEAAQLVAHWLAPAPGQQVWDACAGLGTKTAHLAQLMQNRGRILATDRHTGRLDRLAVEMARLGITIVRHQPLDLQHTGTVIPDRRFDRVLLDAPCSGLGVLGKNPDGKWAPGKDDLQRFAGRQLELVCRTAGRLKPGGILVYAVCSFEKEENEAVVFQFLKKHPDFGIYRPEPGVFADLSTLITADGFLRVLPHRHGMDGFFAAAVQRRTE